MSRPIVACVLRSGGPTYDPRWVYALKRGANQHLPDHEFICLTDVGGITPNWRAPMTHPWPGWWAKMGLFDPELFPRDRLVLYFDLDTLLLGDLTFLAEYDGEFGMIRGFYHPVRQSGVMAWRPGRLSDLVWEKWMEDPDGHISSFRGDGRWLHQHLPEEGVDQLLDLFPGRIVSYKVDAKQGPPDGARVVCGHGKPRFSSSRAGWAHVHWRRMTDAI